MLTSSSHYLGSSTLHWNFLKCRYFPCLIQAMTQIRLLLSCLHRCLLFWLILIPSLSLNLSSFTMMCLDVVVKIFIFLCFIALFEYVILSLSSVLSNFFRIFSNVAPAPIPYVLFLLEYRCIHLRTFHPVPYISYSVSCIFYPFYSLCFILSIFSLPKF